MVQDQWSSLVGAWWEHHRLAGGTRAERTSLELGEPPVAVAADERVREIIEAGGRMAIDVLLALAHAVTDGDDPAYLGAGPVEDLVDIHGVPAAAEVAEAARLDPYFARAVTSLWIPAGLDAEGRSLLSPWTVRNSPRDTKTQA